MLRQLVFTQVTVVRERTFLSRCCRSGHPGCATAWAEPVRAQAKSVEGFSLINMATKWGYWTLAERIKGLTQEAEVKETVAAAVQGGGSIPPQFKGAPPPRANRTRRVLHPVLIGHAASLLQGRCSGSAWRRS
jgi:hypothetical protein